MTNNKQKTNPENPNNQFSNSEPMTFTQKVEYVKSIDMTNNKQQTAVEWFLEELEEKGKAYEENQVVRTINICIDVSDYMELKQQANERHKQQIINAVDDQNNYDSWPSSIPTLGEQYYNEAYGGNK
jgi:hypothetical protein